MSQFKGNPNKHLPSPSKASPGHREKNRGGSQGPGPGGSPGQGRVTPPGKQNGHHSVRAAPALPGGAPGLPGHIHQGQGASGSPSSSKMGKGKKNLLATESRNENIIAIEERDRILDAAGRLSVSPPPPPATPTEISALPENVLELLFSMLDIKEVVTVSSVCSSWARVVSDENGDVWRAICNKKMDRETLSSDLLSSCPSFRSKLRAFFHAWNPRDVSRNMYVKSNGFTIHRNPVAQSTDGARGKNGFHKGRHCWEVKWEGPLGTVAVVGLATRDADLRAQGYIALLGKDELSWGWNLVENVLLHNGDSQGNYPLVNNAPRYQVGERIRVVLDCEDRTLSFEKNDEFLGVAFRDLPPGEPLFPAVSAVYGNSEISMVYLGPPLDG